MLDYWTPYVYCHSDILLGFLFVSAILFFYQKIWWIIGGITWKSGALYLTYLIVYGFNEQLFLNWILTRIWPESKPLCTFTTKKVFNDARAFGLPSLEAQLTFYIASFLIGHMFLEQNLTKFKASMGITVFPLFTMFALYITRNATGFQLITGAMIGFCLGLLKIVTYHFILKTLIHNLTRYSFLKLIIPDAPLVKIRYEDTEDAITLMLKPERSTAI